MAELPSGPPMDLANMRQNGCASLRCHASIANTQPILTRTNFPNISRYNHSRSGLFAEIAAAAKWMCTLRGIRPLRGLSRHHVKEQPSGFRDLRKVADRGMTCRGRKLDRLVAIIERFARENETLVPHQAEMIEELRRLVAEIKRGEKLKRLTNPALRCRASS